MSLSIGPYLIFVAMFAVILYYFYRKYEELIEKFTEEKQK